MDDPGPSTLILAGYVPLVGRGFALPSFATTPRPNVWYTATCSVEADHAGQITGFEVFDSGDILQLPADLQRDVQIGSAWTDVFLWNDKVLVGTPQEIWNALEVERDTMLSAVPLTGLDLALAIPDRNVGALISFAVEYMRSRFGSEKARAWQSGTLARQQLLIQLRRLAKEAGLGPEAFAAVAGLEIMPVQNDQLRVQLPPDIVAQFARLGREAELDSRIRGTVERLGLILADTAAAPSKALADRRKEPPPPSPERDVENTNLESDQTIRILIVVNEGRRAQDVARHISQPEWKPDWIARSQVFLEIETIDRNIKSASKRYVGDRPWDDELSYGGYDVIVLLTEELPNLYDILDEIPRLLAERAGPNWKGVSLLAPILPEDIPSEILSGGTSSSFETGTFFRFDALVDTSVVRSPFWTGNPRRALDRRTADMVVGAALLCGGDSPLRERVKSSGRRRRALTFALTRTASSELKLGLASEATWARDEYQMPRDPWTASFVAHDVRSGFDSRIDGIAEIRDLSPQFENFASAVLQTLRKLEFYPEIDRHMPVPVALRKELVYKNLVAGFNIRDRSLRALAISAEAPTLDALKAAGTEGWAVVRYTDKESITELILGKSNRQLPYLPRELRLPNISKRPQNRGLATRGIDPRDVVRVSREDWVKWEARLPSSLRAEVRTYRTSLSRSIRTGSGSSERPEVVLPRRAIQQAIEEGSRWAQRLIDQVDGDDRHYQSAGKRLSDLRVAWSKPAGGAFRYILADGVIPGDMEELRRDEVPAQRFFIIDGDEGVPALLGSRIFAAWARITLTRSTSWMPRFSVGRTFETFPVPLPFLIRRAADGSSQIKIAAGNAQLRKLAGRLHGMYRKRSMGSARALQFEIDRVILKALKLKESSSDLAIVELLLRPEYAY